MPPAKPERESHDERFAPALAAADATGTAQLRRFAHFRILGSLGGGGMGDVYLALDEKLGRKVALKVIRPEALWSQDAKLRFHREALAIGRLDHPNICRLHEAGEHDGLPFMALQFLEGETLAQSLEKSRASAPATRTGIMAIVLLIEQVARALHHAHGHGLVHRDIKPGNIMIGADGRPVVLDFGLARDERNLEATLASSRCGVGTPLYMSPEQIARTGPIDARTDVYSLGVTLYECLTHVRPFDAPTEAELADLILANRYTDPRKHNRQLPPELGLVIACALDRDPERRYRTALAMAEDLRRVIDLQPVAARPIGKALRLRRWLQRNPVLLGVGSLAGIALLGVAFAVKNANEARAQQGIATARADEARTSLDMFRLLADVVQLQDGKAIERTLHPPYPDKAQAMRDWLRDYGEPLTSRLPALEAALVELRKQAKARTPREKQAEQESHPRYPELRRLEVELAARQLAFDVRTGKAQVAVAELDAETKAKTAADLNQVAWLLVRPADIAQRAYGQEAFALACARLALAKFAAGDHTVARPVLLDTLALACLRNGLDAEAMQRSKAAHEEATADQKGEQPIATKWFEDAIARLRNDDAADQLPRLRKRIADVDAEIATMREFEDDGQRFLHVTLSRLVSELRAFTGEQGEPASVRRRLQQAESVLGKSIEDHRAAWDAAVGSIAKSDGVVASRLYDHLVLKPQIGLAPIGMDPKSKLWEFAHLASGELARRDPHDGQLVTVGATGIVFVLIPGGTFAMGAQKQDPKDRNYDPAAQLVESPVHDVTLGPFFLSKYEMTHGQWRRLASEQPGAFAADAVARGPDDTPLTLQRRLANVDWTTCDRLMTETGLCIPTEAQWEYGCRAGTTTPRSMVDRASPGADLAPVEAGRLGANAFGLHDTRGIMNEWCRDWMAGYERPVQPGDGLRLGGSESRTFRGGVRTAGRSVVRAVFRDPGLGLRPARVVTP